MAKHKCKNADCSRMTFNKHFCSQDCFVSHTYNESNIELEQYRNSNVPPQEIFYEPTKTISAHTNY